MAVRNRNVLNPRQGRTPEKTSVQRNRKPVDRYDSAAQEPKFEPGMPPHQQALKPGTPYTGPGIGR